MNTTIRRVDSAREALLQALADEISIPPGMAEEASDRFSSIAKWLNREGSILASADPHLHPQGSFLLGALGGEVEIDDEGPHPSMPRKRLHHQTLGSNIYSFEEVADQSCHPPP